MCYSLAAITIDWVKMGGGMFPMSVECTLQIAITVIIADKSSSSSPKSGPSIHLNYQEYLSVSREPLLHL